MYYVHDFTLRHRVDINYSDHIKLYSHAVPFNKLKVVLAEWCNARESSHEVLSISCLSFVMCHQSAMLDAD